MHGSRRSSSSFSTSSSIVPLPLLLLHLRMLLPFISVSQRICSPPTSALLLIQQRTCSSPPLSALLLIQQRCSHTRDLSADTIARMLHHRRLLPVVRALRHSRRTLLQLQPQKLPCAVTSRLHTRPSLLPPKLQLQQLAHLHPHHRTVNQLQLARRPVPMANQLHLRLTSPLTVRPVPSAART